MSVRDVVLDTAAVTGVACLLVLTVSSFFPRDRIEPTASSENPEPVSNWESLTSGGHRRGPSDAPVTIVSFVDFECPFCRTFALETERKIARKYQGKIALVVRHLPLSYHRFAEPAAIAAECAAAQERFTQMYDVLYTKQDSLGLKGFREFAGEAGVSDFAAFDDCIASGWATGRIADDVAAAKTAGVHSTPTVIVNGTRLAAGPDEATLDAAIQEALNDASIPLAAEM